MKTTSIAPAPPFAFALFIDPNVNGAAVDAVQVRALVPGEPAGHVVSRVGLPASCVAEGVPGFVGIYLCDDSVPPGAEGRAVRQIEAIGAKAGVMHTSLRELAESAMEPL